MSGERRKIQQELAFAGEGGGEAQRARCEGTEPRMAESGNESPAGTERLMEEVCKRENAKEALKRVRANKGAPGVDGMRVDELPGHLKQQWPRIKEQLLAGTYKPKPVKRVNIPKPGGGERALGIPTVLDRFVQQAVLQVMQPLFEPTFSDHSYGFRPGRSAHQAVARAQEHIREGNTWVVDMDLEKFFDRVNHDRLMARVARKIGDKRLLKLLRGFLNSGVMEGGLVSPTTEGTPQGGPLSPLLSNIVLDELDRELERRGHKFVRYADDCNIYVKSERAGHRVMENVSRFITRKLKLKVNENKSAVDRPGRRKFLGFSFMRDARARRRIAPESIKRFRDRVRAITRRSRGKSIGQIVEELRRYMLGWRQYFGYCQTPSVLKEQEEWVRHRLRSYVWKQWKRGTTRFAALTSMGVSVRTAATAVRCHPNPWAGGHCPAAHIALTNNYFAALGLPTLVL